MVFNSLAFALFLPTVFFVYWCIPRQYLRAQNTLVLLVSYIFYGWWDWRFLSLIFASSLLDFLCGYYLERTTTPAARKALLAASLIGNLGLLGFFKYYNFFVESFAQMVEWFGLEGNRYTLQIILPAGISFYTFQTLSYTIDVYKKELKATSDPIAFFAFVSFFPQLVAGPIERAAHLLPQFSRARNFDLERAKDGLRQILWGLFKKIVIADNLGHSVDLIYLQYETLHGIELALGTVYFALQIYCDFSGYSDIAIGCGRLFGINLSRNFAYPYFSRDIAEFWRRWHMSLSTWFRDYLYLPLGGSRTNRTMWIRNILLTFTISGFWHGASWNYIVWGFLHGLYYVPLIFAGSHRQHTDIVAADRFFPTFRECLQMTTTFLLVLVAWIFFRSPSLEAACGFIAHMLTHDWLVFPGHKQGLAYIGVLVMVEWAQRAKEHGFEIGHLPVMLRWALYYATVAGIFWYGYTGHIPFFYFQF